MGASFTSPPTSSASTTPRSIRELTRRLLVQEQFSRRRAPQPTLHSPSQTSSSYYVSHRDHAQPPSRTSANGVYPTGRGRRPRNDPNRSKDPGEHRWSARRPGARRAPPVHASDESN